MDFTSVASSNCDHKFVGLASYRGLILTTGSYGSNSCHVRSELYNPETDRWNDAPNYPYHT